MSSLRLPVLFVGHGSPMNALADNAYSRMLAGLAQRIPQPKVILAISAHWMTQGTQVTAMQAPKTIHDFRGFPQALFDIQYPAPGAPQMAERIVEMFKTPPIQATSDWGLDHGTWSVLRHMYPTAKIPVMQLSLAVQEKPEYHLDLGRQLARLREEGVLILGSGNVVHNLRQIEWEENSAPYPWAVAFNQSLKTAMQAHDLEAITQLVQTPEGRLSVPTPEHFQPLYYILGAADATEAPRFEFDEVQNGSIAMLTVSFGLA